VPAFEAAVWVDEVDLPGMVAALTALKMATPANPATATAAVRRFNNWNAASRVRTLVCVW
jgi:hypothetical protein